MAHDLAEGMGVEVADGKGLHIWSDAYFCSIRKRAITYCRKPSDASVKAFATEAEANRYLTKYEDRLSKFNFHPERYCKSEVIA